ncbi:hypothetical protein VTN31DRAFT_1881 [Thermomyces dupontii]|uniref:uncharacterized protein n=1 Tax=Talaromyces thermophilus TaxID=28565 RepID=UPI0037425010
MTDQTSSIQTHPVEADTSIHLPRITIHYCTQCKWMLRAAYFAQELLSTFSTSLGEVALVPTTGGVFTVRVYTRSEDGTGLQETVLWDRKTNGGFPEVKMLKSLVRNIVDPARDLGHVDRALKQSAAGRDPSGSKKEEEQGQERQPTCEDCR